SDEWYFGVYNPRKDSMPISFNFMLKIECKHYFFCILFYLVPNFEGFQARLIFVLSNLDDPKDVCTHEIDIVLIITLSILAIGVIICVVFCCVIPILEARNKMIEARGVYVPISHQET